MERGPIRYLETAVLREAWTNSFMTQQELATAAGMRQPKLNALLTGKHTGVRRPTLERLARALGLTDGGACLLQRLANRDTATGVLELGDPDRGRGRGAVEEPEVEV